MSPLRVRLNLPEAFRQARQQVRKMDLPAGVRDVVLCLLGMAQYHGKAYGCYPYRRTIRRTLYNHYGRVSRTRADTPGLADHERLAESTLGDWIRGAEAYGLIVRQLRYHKHRARWNRSTLYVWGPVLWSLGPYAWKVARAKIKAEVFTTVRFLLDCEMVERAKEILFEHFPKLSFEDYFLDSASP